MSDWIPAKKFTLLLSVIAFVLSLLPFLLGSLTAPPGSQYLGYQFNTDDHMVYSAWMTQAKNGQFFFDNRFAVDSQPGLTVNLFFWIVGLLSNVGGVALTIAIVKGILSALFVWLLYRLVSKISEDPYFIKISMLTTVFGAGIGYLLWHQFGETITRAGVPGLNSFLLQRLPTDVWQPEGFVFPSMLTNGLFMVSLCLILGVVIAILEAKDSWKAVIWGALCFGILMNIHSYDVLIITLVLIPFVVGLVLQKQATASWATRVALIGIAALPAALWFVHVLREDAVFQARAATETFSPNFRQLVTGYFPMMVFGAIALFKLQKAEDKKPFAFWGLLGLWLFLIIAAASHTSGYWMQPVLFGAVYLISAAFVTQMGQKNITLGFLISWAIIGLILPYFPALFQRKLTMALSIPWGILAGYGIYLILQSKEKQIRNMVGALAIIGCCGSSVLWLQRELLYQKNDLSRTTMQPVYLNQDMQTITRLLSEQSGKRTVVIAMPGISISAEAPDQFPKLFMPDLNPILTGLTGVYTYAGHWSETPNYIQRRQAATSFFMGNTPDTTRRNLISEGGVGYIVAPNPDAFPEFKDAAGVGFADHSGYSEVVYPGSQFILLKVKL